MKKFNDDRIEEFIYSVNNKDFPFTKILPKSNKNDCKKLTIFLSGLNGNSNFIKYFNNECFDNTYLISFDPRAQANNNIKPSQRFKTYLKDLDEILEKYLNENPNINEVYLIGESWGSNLAFLYNKYYPKNKLKGTMGWNMPYEIIDTSKGEENQFMLKLKVLITFLTGIDTYEKSILTEDMCNNPSLRRLIVNSRRFKLSNKVIIACWRSFKNSWNFFLKDKNKDKKILYVQSKEDVLMSRRIFNNYKLNDERIIIWDQGTHILSFDINVADKLFDTIKKFINSN